jgi:hypothetical protein
MIVDMASRVTPVVSDRVVELAQDFLNHKKTHGTTQEKNLYNKIDLTSFFERLQTQRPVMFVGPGDQALLRDGSEKNGGFEHIGTANETAPLTLQDYLSYDEMKISALVSVACPTFFINNGSRYNLGITDITGSYEPQGIHYASVGARFERPGFMEWQDMIVSKEQNSQKNGYGISNNNPGLLRIWEKFYDTKFPIYAEVENLPDSNDGTGNKVVDNKVKYIKIDNNTYLDVDVYKKRLACVVVPFLQYANAQAEEQNKMAEVRGVGIGLGVWQKNTQQKSFLIEVYKEAIESLPLDHITAVELLYVKDENTTEQINNNNNIAFICSQNTPNRPCEQQDNLLISQYAWDSNAYPGNEFWDGCLNASGGSAAACSSLISVLQNPECNKKFPKNLSILYQKPKNQLTDYQHKEAIIERCKYKYTKVVDIETYYQTNEIDNVTEYDKNVQQTPNKWSDFFTGKKKNDHVFKNLFDKRGLT